MAKPQARSKETREKIILAAAKIFDQKGYHLATIGEIGQAAEVTQGAIYFHFKSKEHLALAVIELQHAISRSRAEVILAENRPGVESLIRITARFGHDLIHDPVVRAGAWMNVEKLEFPVLVPATWNDWAEVLATQFARGIREGDLRDNMNISVYSSFLSAAYVGVQTVSNKTTDYANLMEKVFEMWIVIIEGAGIEGRRGSLLGCASEILIKGRQRCDGTISE